MSNTPLPGDKGYSPDPSYNHQRSLPSHIGGYQAIMIGEPTQDGDIWVNCGKPQSFVNRDLGSGYSHVPDTSGSGFINGWHIYRKIPVPNNNHDGLSFFNGTGPLPEDASKRKSIPIATGFIDYFPKAVAAVAHISFIGNEQHNPGKPLHWDRSKSGDEADALMRHFVERGTLDKDGTRHSAKVAWRAMAMLEKELEQNYLKPLAGHELCG